MICDKLKSFQNWIDRFLTNCLFILFFITCPKTKFLAWLFPAMDFNPTRIAVKNAKKIKNSTILCKRKLWYLQMILIFRLPAYMGRLDLDVAYSICVYKKPRDDAVWYAMLDEQSWSILYATIIAMNFSSLIQVKVGQRSATYWLLSSTDFIDFMKTSFFQLLQLQLQHRSYLRVIVWFIES